MKLFDKLLRREPREPELLLTPEMEEDARLVFAPFRRMTRLPDCATSMAAAAVVERSAEPLRKQVLRFAKDAGPGGFIDEELRQIDRRRPESSMRKRRTELSEKNWIVEAGYTRRNSHGQESKVWVHRDWHTNPPPLASATKTRQKVGAVQERERIVAFLRQSGERTNNPALNIAAQMVEEGLHL